jgi:transposase
MRYELTNQERAAIEPMLPNPPRGVPRVNDHRAASRDRCPLLIARR